jgi:iron complex transport system substrate-binding protein
VQQLRFGQKRKQGAELGTLVAAGGLLNVIPKTSAEKCEPQGDSLQRNSNEGYDQERVVQNVGCDFSSVDSFNPTSSRLGREETSRDNDILRKKSLTTIVKRLSIAAFACALVAYGHLNSDKTSEGTQRIVCISQAYTEMIFELGAQASLVGVDLSSTFPPAAKQLPNVGYHRALSAEGILSLNPTLIIHDNNIAPDNVVRQLQQLNIPMKTFAAKNDSIEGTKALLREMGAFFHKEQRAEELCHKLDAGMTEAAEYVKRYKDHPRVAIIHFGRASNVYLLVGNGGGGDAGAAGKMVEWAGGQPAIQKPGMQRMVSPELIAQSNPDVIIMTEVGFDRFGSAEQAKTLPGVAETDAAKHNRIYRVPEHELMYFGPDTGQNIIKLAHLIHGS